MSVLFIIAGIGSLLLSNGHDITPWAPFLTNVFLILFLDSQTVKRGIAILAPLYVLGYFFIWRDVIPAPGVYYYLVAGVYGAFYFIPYAIHRAVNASKNQWGRTLVFPVAWVAIEFLLRAASPYGSWASIAYSQAPDGYLGQLASVGGIFAVSFAIAWISSAAAWLIQRKYSAEANRRTALTIGIVAIALLSWGEWRLIRTIPINDVVRIAAVVPDQTLQRDFESAFADYSRNETKDDVATKQLTAAAEQLNTDLLERSAAAAKAGAKIIAWSETAAKILKRDEQRFLVDASALAREAEIFLFVAYAAWAPDTNKPLQNRLAAITPDGEIAWVYDKSHPIVGSEAHFMSAGSVSTPYLDSPYGIISAAICHDADFPTLFDDAARRNAALFIIPSNDWSEIDWLHANMARYRAVENGFTLFRPAHGVTLATDSRGRLRSWTNTFEAGEVFFLFDLPVQQQRTIFARIRQFL